MRKEAFENLTIKGNISYKRSRGKQHLTYLMSLCLGDRTRRPREDSFKSYQHKNTGSYGEP